MIPSWQLWFVRIGATMGVVGGLAGTSFALDLLRAWTAGDAEKGPTQQAVTFDLPPPPPPRSSAPTRSERAKRPAQTQAKAARAPAAGLTSGLGGLDLGSISDQGGIDDATAASVAGARAAVMTEDAVDDPPRPVERTAPEYPARARAKGISGSVTLSLLVGANGRVRDVRVLKADPPDTFEDAAIAAVQSWVFQPGKYQGEAVDVRVEQTLRFGLE